MEVLLSTFDPKQAVVVDYTGPNLPQFINGDVSIDVITENKIELSSSSKTADYWCYLRSTTSQDGKQK